VPAGPVWYNKKAIGKFRFTVKNLKKSVVFLKIANWLLVVMAWVAALYAYPRLPQKIALWLYSRSQNLLKSRKSLLFFLYPLAQTLFFFGVSFLVQKFYLKRRSSTEKSISDDGQKRESLLELDKEFLWLALIFINLIFIHIQTSLVLLSHGLGTGINPYYFYSIFGILVMLVPYYMIRRKLFLKK
jgi:uncharacterized membrane protein